MPNPELLWKTVPNQRSFSVSDVHIWAADLDKHAEKITSLEQMLSLDELDRAGRFKFETDRNRFIAGRGLLRNILASYLEARPEQMRFTYSPRGKPFMESTFGHESLHFNLAHSRNIILIAITRACPVGIDVEWVRPMSDAEDIAARFFSAGETAKLMALPNDLRNPAFFNLWTRKEAWLKATGDGLSEMLTEVEVSFLADEPARVLAISGNAEVARHWTMLELSPAPGFAAALAVEAKGLQFSCWQVPYLFFNKKSS